MSVIRIEWLADGDPRPSVPNAYGAIVTIDGEIALDLQPAAGRNGRSWDEAEVMRAILERLGHTVTDG